MKLRTLAGACLLLASACASFIQAAEPKAALESLDRHFARELAILAEKCESLALPEQAKFTREWQVRRTAGRHLMFIPGTPETLPPPGPAGDLAKKWHDKFMELRAAQAESLFAIARDCVTTNSATAYRLLHEVLRENPNHSPARRVLGYVQIKANNDWEPYVPSPVASIGRTPHPKTGWQAGKYWRVDSRHWRIATNHSAAGGIEAAKKLEEFHQLWKQTFFDFWCTAADLEFALECGTRLPEPAAPMNVYLFKLRDEYVKFLLPSEPAIAMTQGYYAADQQVAVFYLGDGAAVLPTWYHEAAHQLFQQWRGSPAGIGDKQNFWMVEGAAMYAESLQNHATYWTVGGWQADRLQIPRYRALAGERGLPLEKLVALGRKSVQDDRENIRQLYSQAAATAHFLFDHRDPKYRLAGSLLLRQLYASEDKLTSLATLTGKSLAELDQEQLQALQVTDEDVLSTPGLSRLRNLALGRTQVTEKGLAALAACRELRWLDLSGLPVTDEGLQQLKGAAKLDQLFLDGTKITSASLPIISQFSLLAELDLSNTLIDDQSLTTLGKLRQLKTLHLNGSQVTTAGLQQLRAVLPKTQIEY